jgi:hypothetical protein
MSDECKREQQLIRTSLGWLRMLTSSNNYLDIPGHVRGALLGFVDELAGYVKSKNAEEKP